MFKDAFRRELQPGDYVTYGKSFGRCAGLGVGRVLAVREATVERLVEDSTKKYGYRTVRVPSGEFVLDVMTLQGWRPIEKPEHCTKTTLQFEERVLRLTAEEIPQEQRAILDEAYTNYLADKAKKEKGK